jgi:hypothetical protein
MDAVDKEQKSKNYLQPYTSKSNKSFNLQLPTPDNFQASPNLKKVFKKICIFLNVFFQFERVVKIPKILALKNNFCVLVHEILFHLFLLLLITLSKFNFYRISLLLSYIAAYLLFLHTGLLCTKMPKTARNSASPEAAKRHKFTIDADIFFLPYEMYHIMAQYYSKDLTEQMDFLEAISNSDELQFSSVTRLFSLEHTADITDVQWMNYKPLLTSSPNNLKITEFTKDTRELQRILISCPNLTTLKLTVARFNGCYNVVFPTGLTTLHLDFFGAKTQPYAYTAYTLFSYLLAGTPELNVLGLCNFDGSVYGLELPSKLSYLNFGDLFNHPVDKLVLPSKLVYLNFGDLFNHPVDKLVLPSKLLYLNLGNSFNQPVDKLVLPFNLKNLDFGYGFNQPVDKLVLPFNLKTLDFGNAFNQPVDKLVLPFNLTNLDFGYAFNQPVNKLVLPFNLKNLEFGYAFKQPVVELVFPPNLQTIKFGDGYAEFVYKHHYGDILIPKTVSNLTLGNTTFKFV